MCGIAGIVNLNNEKIEDFQLRLMSSFLRERGPDNEDIWINKNVGLAHRRLSIIDLSVGANQPMLDVEETVAITFNGEIYNFLELKQELLLSGVKFQTNSDTEVIIYGYKIWGIEKLLDKLDGMFAFGLHDILNQKLFLCRDRFGKKPLYYSIINKSFYFSSDIRSIIKFIPNLELDYESVDFYLSELGMPQPKTIWKGVSQVYKSSFLTLDMRTSQFTTASYWKIDFSSKLKISFQEAEELVEKTLTQAILKRKISDVPIGCFLSGGVDSGLIVALMAQNSSERIKTFSIGFKEDDYNELPLAKEVAVRYNTEHTEVLIDPKIENDISDLVDYFAEPFADSSAIPTYYVCKEMRKHLTVALSGDGGDEMFGYSNYAFLQKVDFFAKKYPTEWQRELVTSISKITTRLGISNENYGSLNQTYKLSSSGIALIRGMGFQSEEKNLLYASDFMKEQKWFTLNEVKKIWSKYKTENLTDSIFLASLDTRLLNDYLVKVDRASMKNSLEVRSPFLDKNLANLAFKIPNEFKISNGIPKYILKTLAQKHIDKNILLRKKQGFGIPVEHWLKNELKPLVNQLLSEQQILKRGFFNPKYIQRLIREHDSGLFNHNHKIWSLLWFELWCQKNLDK
ncbi:MAG: asparagine synthase (glutamine-hydrolyzing) [Bacteroidetes bacterium RIFCSPLOWO2_12_FULL_35_15]|nr:MAG: asparagine synthase (glutamine-hydrolyzing) [Bacteroidetes bacterium RIFCSPLOWO2_12_FULL_35_15]